MVIYIYYLCFRDIDYLKKNYSVRYGKCFFEMLVKRVLEIYFLSYVVYCFCFFLFLRVEGNFILIKI